MTSIGSERYVRASYGPKKPNMRQTRRYVERMFLSGGIYVYAVSLSQGAAGLVNRCPQKLRDAFSTAPPPVHSPYIRGSFARTMSTTAHTRDI